MSALGDLYDAIVAEFAADAQSTAIAFGTRQIARQINQGAPIANRVVVSPIAGADTIGPILPPRNPPSFVAMLNVSATVFCWAADVSTAEAAANERAQYDAVLALFSRTMRAIVNAKSGEVTFGQVRKVAPDKKEAVLGQEWAFDITVIEDCDANATTSVSPRTPAMTTTFTLPAPTG